ncbi:VWA domain-containing protein [Longispora sp. NPDC051575]|uniref:vWA domain-containing protein n=1 Tax=Longispora sp. NPDC051575 TaxID=3154943 RepID=UPI003422EEA8
MADDKLLVLAFYVVVDVSISMEHNGGLIGANTILPTVADAIEASPTLGDVVRFGAMDFSDDARVVLRLGDIRDVRTLPQFTVRGGTSYEAAFTLLRQEIDRDVAQLRSDNYRVYRPAVFFITDGEPTDAPDALNSAFEHLTSPSFAARPNLIPFGVGGATKALLDPWVYPKEADSKKSMRSYVAKDGVRPEDAVRQIAEVLVSSVIASAGSVNSAGSTGGFVPPADDDLEDWL